MSEKPKRWSYSSLSTYKACPKKWYFSYVENLPWPSSPAMSRGTRMHTMAEEYVLGKISFIPTDIKRIGPLLEILKTSGAKPEATFLVDKEWGVTDDQSQAWVKAIVDVHYLSDNILYVKDYKSGQMYPDHREQLELYGILGLLKYPEVKRVEVSAVYMDTGHEGMEGTIIRAMLPKLIEKWDGDAKAMYADNDYEPRPGVACRWCPYAQGKGGPCQY